MTNEIKESWNNYSDEYYQRTYMINDNLSHLKKDPLWAFPAPIRKVLCNNFQSFHGIRILVPSSGDNGAVFAFHLLGAEVTSSDISENQLKNAKQIADSQKWNIEFVCTDSMTLDGITDNEYDLIYTSNGVHVWISDLPSMYHNYNRVLKPDGQYIMFETHPFNRPFDDSTDVINVTKDYNNTDKNHWRIMDLFNAIVEQGFEVQHLEEFHAEIGGHDLWWYKTLKEAENDNNRKFDIQINPWAALPQWIGFSAKKRS